jgi:hypothetical protein
MLAGRPDPSFELVGYVAADNVPVAETSEANGIPRMGTLRQLRDVVRVNNIDDVVFAASDMSNHMMFKLMQLLRGLTVSFKVLAHDSDHIIGKASIEDLSTPMLVGADSALGHSRLQLSRRSFDIAFGMLLLLLIPAVWILSKMGSTANRNRWQQILTRARRLPGAILGKCALVGYEPETRLRPPDEWGLHPGVFSIIGGSARQLLTDEELRDAYWLYARNQSAALDLSIILRRIQRAD